MQLINIGCLNIHVTHLTANNAATNNVVFFFVLDLKNSIQLQLLIPYHNALDKRSRIFCVTTYL